MKALRWPALVLAGWLLPAVSSAQVELFNGFPETVSGNQDEILTFYLDVPAGITSLEFITTGGSGDADIYVNFGEPFLTSADPTAECISVSDGDSEEYCVIEDPTPGLWYVEVYGFTAFADVGLIGIAATELANGEQRTISGAFDSIQWYYVEVPAGQDQLSVNTGGGTGDPDLFVGTDLFGNPDCVSAEASTVESCQIGSPVAGRWYLLIYGFDAYSGVTLGAGYSTSGGGGGGGGALAPGALGVLLLTGLAGLGRRRLRGRPAPTP